MAHLWYGSTAAVCLPTDSNCELRIVIQQTPGTMCYCVVVQQEFLVKIGTVASYVFHLVLCMIETLKEPGVQAKIFRGKDISLLYSQLKILFPEVSVVKPWSSRNSSIEAFVLCRNYTPPADFEAAAPALLHMLSFKSNNIPGKNVLEASLGTGADTTKICGGVLPFLACGSLQWDSDMNYDLEEVEEGSDKATERLQPVQPPLAPHYKEAMEKINRWRF